MRSNGIHGILSVYLGRRIRLAMEEAGLASLVFDLSKLFLSELGFVLQVLCTLTLFFFLSLLFHLFFLAIVSSI